MMTNTTLTTTTIKKSFYILAIVLVLNGCAQKNGYLQNTAHGDNDEDYYPLYTYGKTKNEDNTKGVYEPFATDNVIPYDSRYYEDNDNNYYPYIYDY